MAILARRIPGTRAWWAQVGAMRLSLAGQYLLASLLVFAASMVVIGSWVGGQIEAGVLDHSANLTALYVESMVSPSVQSLASGRSLSPADVTALNRLLTQTPLGKQVVALKVWSGDGTILFSTNAGQVGQKYPVDGGLEAAWWGEVSAQISDLSDPQDAFERPRWTRLLDVYVPIRDQRTGRVIACAEFHQPLDELERVIVVSRARSWAVVGAVTLAAYLLLAGIVKRGSDTIRRQRADLQAQVARLSRLLRQNDQLRERVRRAAGRATAINEQALRRISRDLHDGPGQSLALALLRLDSAQERINGVVPVGEDFAVVKQSVEEALAEIRGISSGLRAPELARISIPDIVDRVVGNHARLTGARVSTELVDAPDDAPLAVKIALFRSLQETLSNATRHAHSADIAVRLWAEASLLCLAVSDRGPGFVVGAVDREGRLGLAGMREQAELLGGHFDLQSSPGRGTTVRLCWPMAEPMDSSAGGVDP